MSLPFWRRGSALLRRYAGFYAAGLQHSAGATAVERIRAAATELARLPDNELRALRPASRPEAFAKAVVACERVLKLRPHDVQILGALAMAEGAIAEMQTGEGKTLAAVLAVYDLAREGDPVHVLTANDYLAERDARWMGPVYEFLGLSAGFITQHLTSAERRQAYAADVTYATANEVGFDFLRDQLALHTDDLVLPEPHTVLIDEADSILIDEARIPLVIAGGEAEAEHLARRMAQVAETLHVGIDCLTDPNRRNVRLTDSGIARVERQAGIANLYAEENLQTLAAIEAALHARLLLQRDIDYVVRNDGIELVDEFKGRVAENRRWPAGLQTALEAKEGLPLRTQGRILGSITLQNLIRMYPRRCGMTGTAATEAHEFREFYGMDVVPIPTNRPVVRDDLPDFVFPRQQAKERSVVTAIAEMHATGRPVLVGTASVAESERLSALASAAGIPHRVLNARQDAEEAAIIARAGERGAVTISTNMAGRGTDIVLGEGVAELGGLHVIGTNRHESRRVDHQLRGRAGRQGDPGSSRFYISLQDDLLVRYGIEEWDGDIEAVQRVIEGQHLDLRQILWKYDGLVESQRRVVHHRRRELLDDGAEPALLLALDDLWAGYLAWAQELREGIHWRSWGGRNPYHEFVHDITAAFDDLLAAMERLKSGEEPLPEHRRGATWTYLVTDNPWGTLSERIAQAARRQLRDLGILR